MALDHLRFEVDKITFTDTKNINQLSHITSHFQDELQFYGSSTSTPVRIKGADTPIEDTDVANKKYVDDNIGGGGGGGGGVGTVTISGNHNPTGKFVFENTTDCNLPRTDAAILVKGGVGVDKTLVVGGEVHSQGFNSVSDMRKKESINPLKSGLIDPIQPVSYSYKDDPEHRIRFGVIAQDLEKVPSLKSLVHENGEVLTVDYTSMISILLTEVKELKKKVDEIEKKI